MEDKRESASDENAEAWREHLVGCLLAWQKELACVIEKIQTDWSMDPTTAAKRLGDLNASVRVVHTELNSPGRLHRPVLNDLDKDCEGRLR